MDFQERKNRRLDDKGYCGHLSSILQLVQDQRFRKTYLGGGFALEDIREFAVHPKIGINRMLSGES